MATVTSRRFRDTDEELAAYVRKLRDELHRDLMDASWRGYRQEHY